MVTLGEPVAAGAEPTAAEEPAVTAPSAAAAPSGFTAVVSISTRTAPTGIVAPSAPCRAVIMPLAVEGTSTSTLSVVTSTSVSPSSTHSPTFLRHSTIEPSLTDSPISGRVTFTSVSEAIDPYRTTPGTPGLRPTGQRPGPRHDRVERRPGFTLSLQTRDRIGEPPPRPPR